MKTSADWMWVIVWLVLLYFTLTYFGVIGFYFWALVITLLGLDNVYSDKE